jgi:hypothetical protein
MRGYTLNMTAAMLLAGAMGQAAADACTPYPETFAQAFYRSAYSFYNAAPEQSGGWIAPMLLTRLQEEHACVIRKGSCRLHYDPWLGAQDGSVGHPLQFRRETEEGDRSSVSVSYPVTVAEDPGPRTVTLKLRRSAASGCWQLEDFITARNESLAALLKGPLP